MCESNPSHNIYQHEDDLSKKEALELCADHLGRGWLHALQAGKVEDTQVKVIPAGFANRIFVVSHPMSSYKVLVRLYGGKIVDNKTTPLKSIGIEGEVLICHFMHVNRIGPKLYGVFEGGRLEEFKEKARVLTMDDCQNRELVSCFAKKLAQVHSLVLPLSKKPRDYVKIIRDNFDKDWVIFKEFLEETPFPEGSPEHHKELVQKVINYDFMQPLEWVTEHVSKIKSPVVFSHNDMNLTNCLINPEEDEEDKITLIDFEFSGYNYRGCDIGRHFHYRGDDVTKYSKNDPEAFTKRIAYPSEEERRFFVKEYLSQYKRLNGNLDDSIDNEDHVLLESEVYGSLVKLFLVWYLINNPNMIKKLKLPVHPGILLSEDIIDFQEMKDRVDKILKVSDLQSL